MANLAKLRIWDDAAIAGAPPTADIVDGVERFSCGGSTFVHLWRGLKEDRNQHYQDLSCPCWHDAKTMARFKEPPKHCSSPWCCGNMRKVYGPTIQERRASSDVS